ncbi:galactokinase family protein, partial [Sphingorhabdus sp.]|uniref:galactokinase family protein n=1 Tax=Sphingorhabdus sp. TaxID=1902408 RepID=UPI0040549A97
MTPQDQALHDRVTASFAARFGHASHLVVRAPGRVNLIGEHTDYNDGFVLPCAIGPATMVAVSKRHDNNVEVVAADFGDARDQFNLELPLERNIEQPWADYVRGMMSGVQNAGYALSGANIAIAGNLPKGAGLSSSASLEVAVGKANLALADIDIDNTRLAQIAQRAECDFVGTKCGIMDQLISAQGKAGHALLIDCRSLGLTDVPVPDDVAIMIVHSGVTRGLV